MTSIARPSSRPRLPHVPALDGLRGLAVIGVLLFHGGFSWAIGGYLGVSAFFTLSGYLITSLLLVEWDATGSVSLRGFWTRRFRRLLPAALVVLAAVAVAALFLADSGQLASLRADMVAALANVANWRFVLDERSYAELFTGPSPLQHYWSLSIEEQFYVVFPALLVVLLRVAHGRRALIGGVLGALAAGSLAWSWTLAATPSGLSQAYYDTGARAAELLAGSLLALVLAGRPHRVHGRPRLLAAGGTVALALLIAGWVSVAQATAALHRGGLALHALLVVVVLASAHVPGPVRTLCSVRPLRAAGTISYGLYLIHWPVFVWLDAARTGLEGTPLFAVQLAVTVGLALASYAVVEQPIRLGRLLPGRQALGAMATAGVAVLALAVIVPTTAQPADEILVALDELRGADAPPAAATTAPADAEVLGDVTAPAPAGEDASPSSGPSTPPATVPSDERAAAPPSTTIPTVRSVLLVGDSVMSQAMPSLEARFAARGVSTNYAGGPATGPLSPQGDWARQIDAWVGSTDPDVVVIEACCNYTYEPPERYRNAAGLPVAPNSAEALVVWELEMRDLVRRAGAGGADVFLVRFPPVQTNGYYGPIEGHVLATNAMYDRIAADTPGIRLIDWSTTLAPGGAFAWDLPVGGQLVPVRLQDGVHLTEAGSDLVADVTVAAVVAA